MSKPKKKLIKEDVAATNKRVEFSGPASSTDKGKSFLYSFFLILTCIILYSNTLNNGYAVDDHMMITENTVTQKGFNGIKEHLQHSFLYGFMHQEGYDAGSSHWRPLVLISFAIEIGLWGPDKPGNSHAVNLLLYICIVISLFGLLRKYIFKDIWLSFFSALLFAIHPVHTEVVSNIKGRDEMICLLCILLSLHLLWKFVSSKKGLYYFLSLAMFFLALSAKENSLTFLAGIPLMLYFFSELTTKQILLYTGGFLFTTVAFIIIRNSIVPLSLSRAADDITNNPYLFATSMEEISTKIYVLLLYLRLAVFPDRLTYDYSYNHIPYVNTNNVWVWLSLLLYASLFVYALMGLKSKRKISFAILMFFITLSVSSNILVSTGVMIAERMLFIPSIFVAMMLAIFGKETVAFLYAKFNIKKMVLAAVLIIPIFIAATVKIIRRNKEWDNDISINLADIKTSPQSARVNMGAGHAYYMMANEPDRSKEEQDSLFKQSIKYYQKAVTLYPKYTDAWISMGYAYVHLDNLSKAETSLNSAINSSPLYPAVGEMENYFSKLFLDKAIEADRHNSFDSAISYYQKANSHLKLQDSAWLLCNYNLGGAYYRKGALKNARDKLTEVVNVSPGYPNVRSSILAIDSLLKLR